MSDYERVLVLENEIEAQRFGLILDEEGIPYRYVSYHDTAYDGLFQMQRGWGHVEAPGEYSRRISGLYADMKRSTS